jgi:tripartite-type tricarboxylate transporter receptor subunit TctC
MKRSLKHLLRVITVLAAVAMLGAPAWAKYPEKPIEMIIAWSAGGGSDLAARLIAEYAGKEMGQPIIANNVPGANGALAWATAVQAKPDGYTITSITFDILSNQAMGTTPVKYTDFELIMQFTKQPLGIFAHKDSPYKNLKELVAAATKDPEKVTMAITPFGGSFHQAVGLLEMKAKGAKFKCIPYKASAEIIAALSGNHVNAGIQTFTGMEQHVASGNIHLIAVLNPVRVKEFPDAPTALEQGYDVSWSLWRGIAAPKGISPEVRETLVDAFTKAFNNPEYREKAKKAVMDIEYRDPKEFKAMIDKQYPDLLVVLRNLKIVK